MGFGFRVAPGVRLKVSSRGVSAGIGPRIARAHIGTSGVGISSGVGPFSTSSWVGGGHGGRGSYGGQDDWTESAQLQAEREARRLAKDQAILAAIDEIDRVRSIHRAAFDPASRPIIPEPVPVDEETRRVLIKRRAKELSASQPRFSIAARKHARANATEQVERELDEQFRRLCKRHAAEQAWSDEQWSRLVAGDPVVVLETVNSALADNEQQSAAVNYLDGELSVVILAPAFETTPVEHAALTPSGRPTVHRYNKTERNRLYGVLLCAHVILTAKEVFAVAPAVQTLRSVVARRSQSGEFEALLAATHSRDLIANADYDLESATTIWNRGAEIQLNYGGRTGELRPLSLEAEPELQALLDRLRVSQEPAHAGGGGPDGS